MKVSLEGAQLDSNLYWLGERAWEGQEIVILREGKPYLKVIPHPDGEPSGEKLPRKLAGTAKGGSCGFLQSILRSLTMEIIEAFEGKYC